MYAMANLLCTATVIKLTLRGNGKERRIKLVDFENLAPSPESLTDS